MALLCRNNMYAFRLASNCPKIKSRILKTERRNLSRSLVNCYASTCNKTVDNKIRCTFSQYMEGKRLQAQRSVLIQVESPQLFMDLQQYLNKFGPYQAAYQYEVKLNHYVLIEFPEIRAASKFLKSATFWDKSSYISIMSNSVWFCSGVKQGNPNKGKDVASPFLKKTLRPINSHDDIIFNLQKVSTLSEQMIHFHSIMQLQDLDLRVRFLIAWQLENLFTNIFKNCMVLPFGSSVNGFGKHACDIDLVFHLEEDPVYGQKNHTGILFQAKPITNFNNSFAKNFLDTVGSMLQHFVPGVSGMRKILNARVPIIKYIHDYTGLECDLCVSNLTAVYMSELLWLFGLADNRVRPLVYTIRYWAEMNLITREVAGPWITNFTLTLLVLFFLQQQKILPCLEKLRSNANSEDVRISGNIDCTFIRDLKRFPTNAARDETLAQLLKGFFRYYRSFDFYTQAIDLRTGMVGQKRNNSPMYIVNPLETSLNVSKNVSVVEVDRWKHSCSMANRLFDDVDSEEQNILTLLFSLGADKERETKEYRRKSISPIVVKDLLTQTKQNNVHQRRDSKQQCNTDPPSNSLNVAGVKLK